MSALIRRLLALETEIDYRQLPPEGEPEFIYIAGRLPVLLSAPHGAAHTRNGKIKNADEYTASLARLVAEQAGAHVLYAHHQSNTDPNYDRHAPYKVYLRRLIKAANIRFVLDIHGAAPYRDFGIALGTMHGRTCSPRQRNLIIQTLGGYGFQQEGPNLHRLDHLDLDETFPGGEKQHTITHYVSQGLNVPAVQFELNAYLRNPKILAAIKAEPCQDHQQRLARSVQALVALVRAITTMTAA